MVQLRNYIKGNSLLFSGKQEPMLNTMYFPTFSKYAQDENFNNFKGFMKMARRSPQLIGFLRRIASDVLSDGVEFKPFGKSSGRNNVLKAKAFWINNLGEEVVEETLYDLLLLGIGYNWLAKLDDIQLKEFSNLIVDNTFLGINNKDREEKSVTLFNQIKKNNSDKIPKKLRHVAASTITIHNDEYEVKGYIQRVAERTKEFKPDEILTFRFMPFDGKVYPFPPMEAILAEVYLLWLITQNYVSFFENGGKPDNIFILPKELAGSRNHKHLMDTLKKYKKIQNKHGNMVFTGDLSVEKLMEVEQQMENKDLGLYLVSVLAMMYGIPVGMIPFLVGKAAIGGDAGGISDTGYWRMISVIQRKIEACYNRKLWIPYFNVEFKFKRGYLQDEVRETQNEMQKTQIAEQRLRLGLWTIEEAGKSLNIDEDIIKEAQEQKKQREEEEMKSGMLRQNMENDNNVLKNPDQKQKALTKQKTQNNNQTNAGGKDIKP